LKNFGLVPLRRQRELAVFLPVRPDGAAALVWDIDGDRLRSAPGAGEFSPKAAQAWATFHIVKNENASHSSQISPAKW
jgi:hypothetical protein